MGLGFGYDVVSERFIQPPEDYSLLHTAPNDEMWAGLGCMCVSSLLSQVYCRLMVIFTDWLCVLEIFRKIVLINKLCVRSWTISFAECSSSRGGGDVHVHVHTHNNVATQYRYTHKEHNHNCTHPNTDRHTHTQTHDVILPDMRPVTCLHSQCANTMWCTFDCWRVSLCENDHIRQYYILYAPRNTRAQYTHTHKQLLPGQALGKCYKCITG